jgi:molybdopterin-containing oxidoreductase family iron-sulfur binding subunit
MSEKKVSKTRRNLLKGIAAAGMVGVLTAKREELMKILEPYPKEGEGGAFGGVEYMIVNGEEVAVAKWNPYRVPGDPQKTVENLKELAKKKEEDAKKRCMESVKGIYQRYQECEKQKKGAPECKQLLAAYNIAKKRCQEITVKWTLAKKGIRWAMALDLNKCIGCRRCAYACVQENNVDRTQGIEWIKVVNLTRDELELLNSDISYTSGPYKDRVYIPVACNQCEYPPCIMVCPVRATWQEPDGIVIVDSFRCIGCRYCITACPYGARHLNWKPVTVDALTLNPNMHEFGNVPREVHTVEKCTWCIQRTRNGGTTACVEICPVGARAFGNFHDENGPIQRIIKEYGAFVLKPSAGTKPRFFYYFGPARTPPLDAENPHSSDWLGGGEEGKKGGEA